MISRLTPILLSITSAMAVPAQWSFDANGRLTSLSAAGESVAVAGNVRLPNRGWAKQPSLADLRDGKHSTDDGVERWSGRIEATPGAWASFEQTLENDVLAIRITAEADLDLEGVYLWLDLPIPVFKGGHCTLAGGPNPAASKFPVDQPPARHFLKAEADRLTAATSDGRVALDAKLDHPVSIVVQDGREFGGRTYTALVRFGESLKQGQSATLSLTLAAEIQPDTSPAHLTVDPMVTRYPFDGFGGNYCFNIESPVTDYTLDHLKIAWARCELTAYEWEPQNDNADPANVDWDAFTARDKLDSNLRREFLLAQRIQKMGVPYVVSVWQLPAWLYTDPQGDPRAGKRKIDPAKWPELLECLGSYLLYAKRQYGVEPDLFSFNESDIGVRVWLTAEEHRDAIKRIGPHFESQGLKTRLLLGDTGNARGTVKFCYPTADDPEALKYVGAVSFHSWGGATPEQYGAWADLADRLKLPLLVGELGVDAQAWRGKAYATFDYAMREVRHYQELILHARPRGTMQWEFTSDYGIVAATDDGLQPTKRFYFVQQFCNLTPYHSRALGVASDHPKVLITAFADEQTTTMHISNSGAEREATVTGLPAGTWRALRTSQAEDYAELPAVVSDGGAVTLTLAAQSLLTLTSP